MRHTQRIEPGPGQESVWDYPRPPRLEPTAKQIVVVFDGRVLAQTTRAVRCLETSHPPTYYIPRADVDEELLSASDRTSVCEYKGLARYVGIVSVGRTASDAGWYYPEPRPGYESIAGHLAFYPRLMDECRVEGELVRPQPGGFYGGWITSDVVGPFKGEPGTLGW